jgi:ABC-2 type transport system permease protein
VSAGAFLFVATHSFKNRVLVRLRRLRNPRYAISAAAGLLYFGMMVGRRAFAGGVSRSLPEVFQRLGPDVARVCVGVVLIVLAVGAWALPGDSGGIEFSASEIQFLFPAPLTRRQLLAYKMVRSQAQILLSSVIMTFVAFPRSKFIGVWVAFSVFNTYLLLVGLGRARLRQRGLGFAARIVIVAGVLYGIYLLIVQQLGGLDIGLMGRHLESHVPNALDPFFGPFHRAPLSILFFIPQLFAMVLFPTTAASVAAGAAGLVLLGAIFFLVAARLNVSFEEASIARATRKAVSARRRSGYRSGEMVMFRAARPLFRLAPTGPPEVAILWKNLTAALRIYSGVFILLLLALLGASGVLLWSRDPKTVMAWGSMLLTLAPVMALGGPLMFRNDLRMDLRRLEVIKSYPIAGARLVAAEVAAPAAMIVAIQSALLITAVVLLREAGPKSVALARMASPEAFIATLLVLIPIVVLQLLMQNAVVIFFPAWASRSKEEARGFAPFGQRLVLMAAHLLVLGVLLLPAVAVFLPTIWIARQMTDFGASLAIATCPAVAVLVAEIFLAIQFLGNHFESIDVSNDLEIVADE